MSQEKKQGRKKRGRIEKPLAGDKQDAQMRDQGTIYRAATENLGTFRTVRFFCLITWLLLASFLFFVFGEQAGLGGLGGGFAAGYAHYAENRKFGERGTRNEDAVGVGGEIRWGELQAIILKAE